MLIDTRSTRPQAHFPINVMGRDITLSDELREFVQRRLTTALGRFAAKLRDVDVWFEDVNGPRRGVDIRCRVVLRLKSGRHAIATAHAANAFAAIARAADRAGATLAKRSERLWMARQGRTLRRGLG